MYNDDILREFYKAMSDKPMSEKVDPKIYKMILDVFETNQYTAEDAWGHTEPDRKVVCIRPREFLDYRLMDPSISPIGEVAKHEAFHNLFPDAHEGHILAMGKNPVYNHLLKGVSFRYH